MGFAYQAFGQQDTTKNNKKDAKKDSIIYGFHTSRIFYEEDVFLSKPNLYKSLDTTLTNLHRYNYLQRHKNMYQDAGNMGTALRPIYYQTPEQIGTNLGYQGYDLYTIRPQEMRFYNTMSPLTDIYVAQGGNFRSIITVRFARNINPLWNVGIFYNRIGANKIYGKTSQRNDPQTLMNNYGLHTNFFSRNQRYKLLASFTHYDHTLKETGGTRAFTNNIDSLLTINDGGLQFNLDRVDAIQNRLQARLYHQLALFDTVKFQVYHIAEYIKQTNGYTDKNFDYATFQKGLLLPEDERIRSNAEYYHRFLYPTRQDASFPYFNAPTFSGEIPFQSEYSLFDNKAGLKGRIKNFIYATYAQVRMYSLSQRSIRGQNNQIFRDTTKQRNIPAEYFVGGTLRYEFNDSMRIDAKLDYLLGGDYRIKAVFQRGLWQAGYERVSYRPTLMQKEFFSPFLQWQQNFVNTETDRLFGSMAIQLPFVNLNPYASVTNVTDLVYYGQQAVAFQSIPVVVNDMNNYVGAETQLKGQPTTLQFIQIGIDTKAKWRKWNFISNVIFTKNFGADVFRIPEWFVNAQVFYENKLFKSALLAQFGLDVHWKSAYYAQTYMPVTQEYYLQDKFLVENYINTDLFANFKIKRVLLFIKINNLLQSIVTGNGYYNTPVFVGQARGLELGVNWAFFD
jgi:hypothetical protein